MSILASSLRRRIHEKLRAFVSEKAVPGCQLVLGYKKETLGVFNVGVGDLKSRRPVRSFTWFDLASLTKILVTVDLLMRAKQENKILNFQLPLRTWFPFFASELKNQTLYSLLHHQAGLPATFEYTKEPGEDLPTRDDRVKFFLRKVDETYLPPSEASKTVYSDVGFMLLGLLIEQIYGKRLRQLYQGRTQLSFGPLNYAAQWLSHFFNIPAVAGIQSLDLKPQWLRGVVQDPRAQWLDGDAGHAGLFGTAVGVENWGRELFMAYHGKSIQLSDRVVREFIHFEDAQPGYMFGFDTPNNDGTSQAGSLFASTTIGHLGYSGCSFWMDIERGYRVTLLSHRFQPGLETEKLRNLRPALHDWIHAEVFGRLKI